MALFNKNLYAREKVAETKRSMGNETQSSLLSLDIHISEFDIPSNSMFCGRTLKSLGLSQLSLYISANNLFVLTKYSEADPEVGYGGYGVVTDNAQTPRAKSFTCGITVSF